MVGIHEGGNTSILAQNGTDAKTGSVPGLHGENYRGNVVDLGASEVSVRH